MLLAVDIGNSFTKFGLFDRDTLTSKFSIPTDRNSSAEEIGRTIGDRLNGSIERVVACSVVPEIEPLISIALRDLSGVTPDFVDHSFDLGLTIIYEPVESLGIDRLVGAYAAVEKFGAPSVVCSLGTATTIDVVNADREFLGGIIAPGLDAMSEALHLKAPRLPRVEFDGAVDLIGRSTNDAIRSGIYNGYVSMVASLIEQFRGLTDDSKVIATGGNAKLIADHCDSIEADLILNGLNAIGRQMTR